MTRSVLLVVCLAGVGSYCTFTSTPALASGCPAGTYDMLKWMTLAPGLRSNYHMAGNSNPLYTTMAPGKFYWTKDANGSPWDIQLFDDQYIYLWITELNWLNPQSFKRFANN